MEKRFEEKVMKHSIEFPQKMVFSNFNPKALIDRMNKLQNYLNKTSELLNLVDYPEAWEFFEMEPHTRTLLSSLEYEVQNSMYTPHSQYIAETEETDKVRRREMSEDLILCGGRKETRQISEFLQRLKFEPVMVANTVKGFDELYFTSQLKLTKNEIELLLWGDSKFNGILYYCGNAESDIGANYCLDFFVKLLKYEYNSVEADKFMVVYAATDPNIIKQMRLDKYVKEVKSHDTSGLLALYYYLKYNTHDINEAGDILTDKKAIQEYEEWLHNKVTCGYLFKMCVRKSSSKGAMSETKGASEPEEDEESKVVLEKSLEGIKFNKLLVEASKAASTDRMEYLLEQLDNYSAWEVLDGPPHEADNKVFNAIKAYVAHSKRDFRISFQIHCDDVKKVASNFVDLEKRASWDCIRRSTAFKEGNAEAIHTIFATGGRQKYTDYVLGREIEEDEDLEGSSILIKEFSLAVPQPILPEVKRVQINATVTKVAQKIDINGKKYVECQMLWSVDEGCQHLSEYEMYKGKEFDTGIRLLNKLLS